MIEQIITALLAGGSVLMEDVSGVGKTTLAKAVAAVIDLEYRRVQCTPDLLPADVFEFSIFNQQEGTFEFRRGPVFCNILLLDEINRASPRTQSALLEAMAEHQVTVEGDTYELETPFLVFATQNPAGYQGTFSLPESQLDRFLFKLSMEYPEPEYEVEMLYDQAISHPLESLTPVFSREQLIDAQNEVLRVRVDSSLSNYLVSIINQTRAHPSVRLGCSPRGTQMLFRAAQARAYLDRRDYVLPDDIQAIAPPVLEHRILVEDNQSSSRQILAEILSKSEVPVWSDFAASFALSSGSTYGPWSGLL